MKPSISNKDAAANADRRKYPRFLVHADYLLCFNGVEHQGLVMNISLGGAYLATIDPIITEDSLFQEGDITMTANHTSLLMRCHITYVGTQQSEYPVGVGIAFIENNDTDTVLINEFMEALNVFATTMN